MRYRSSCKTSQSQTLSPFFYPLSSDLVLSLSTLPLKKTSLLVQVNWRVNRDTEQDHCVLSSGLLRKPSTQIFHVFKKHRGFKHVAGSSASSQLYVKCSMGIRVLHEQEAGQQLDRMARSGSWEPHVEPHHKAQRVNWKGHKAFNLKALLMTYFLQQNHTLWASPNNATSS